MRRQIVLALLWILLALPVAMAAGQVPSQRTIILFGANWCAPCVAELRELPDLSTAAAPDRLVIAWTDGAARVPAALTAAGVEQLPQAKARELLLRYGSGNAGLPLVVMTGKDGSRCAMQRRRLTSDGIAALRKDCDAGR